jgi:hypothetical protein
MKTRIFILLAVTAVITLSFTFITVKSKTEASIRKVATTPQDAPVGGFVLQDEL